MGRSIVWKSYTQKVITRKYFLDAPDKSWPVVSQSVQSVETTSTLVLVLPYMFWHCCALYAKTNSSLRKKSQ